MATIVLNTHTRTDGTKWYEVVNAGTQVYSTESEQKARARYYKEVADTEFAEENSTAVTKTHTIVGAPAV
jgi:hypothetical protein